VLVAHTASPCSLQRRLFRLLLGCRLLRRFCPPCGSTCSDDLREGRAFENLVGFEKSCVWIKAEGLRSIANFEPLLAAQAFGSLYND
jgi:hypothetical protein